jgi:opacity protein-like surface antigen
VDNWLFPQFNDEVEVSEKNNYVYKSPATNLRGFNQNIRNGNSYAVLNSELRIPIFRMFNNKPIISEFFNNFQLIAFGDLGSAWTGVNPFDKNNALNREIRDANPIDITVINLSNPFVGGYGLGVRSNLLGYFVRLDYAWGVENNLVKNKGQVYLSLGLDF